MKTIAPPSFPLPRSALKTRTKINDRIAKTNRTVKVTRKAKKKPTPKFYGPVRVLVIDAKGEYCRTVWCAIGLGFANMLIGAVNMAALMYMVVSGNLHVLMCTVGYHFFCAHAILSLNYANGWSTPMRLRHRKFAHVCLQICGMACATAGTAIACLSKGISGKAHGITGLLTIGFATISLISGVFALCNKKHSKIIHESLGIPTFAMSSVSLILGFISEGFRSWCPTTIVIILISSVLLYTIFVMGTVFMKCVSQF